MFLWQDAKIDINEMTKEEVIEICERNDKLGAITRERLLKIKGIGEVKIDELEKYIKYKPNALRTDIFSIALISNRIIFVFILLKIIKKYFDETRMLTTIIKIFKNRR